MSKKEMNNDSNSNSNSNSKDKRIKSNVEKRKKGELYISYRKLQNRIEENYNIYNFIIIRVLSKKQKINKLYHYLFKNRKINRDNYQINKKQRIEIISESMN